MTNVAQTEIRKFGRRRCSSLSLFTYSPHVHIGFRSTCEIRQSHNDTLTLSSSLSSLISLRLRPSKSRPSTLSSHCNILSNEEQMSGLYKSYIESYTYISGNQAVVRISMTLLLRCACALFFLSSMSSSSASSSSSSSPYPPGATLLGNLHSHLTRPIAVAIDINLKLGGCWLLPSLPLFIEHLESPHMLLPD